MISVERVLAYMNLPSEAPLETEENKKPPPGWPQNGVIVMRNACLRYFPDSPLVLKDLNFAIGAKEKVCSSVAVKPFFFFFDKIH